MKETHNLVIAAAVLATAALSASAAPVALDGAIGAEWAGVAPVQVLYDPAAPTSNFGTPTNMNSATAYEIFVRGDSQYIYTAVRTTNGGDASAVFFSNLYFSLRYGPGPYGNNGSSIAFEITNDRAFNPNTGIYYNDTAANLIQFATFLGAQDVIEAAIDRSVFTSNALGVAGYGLPAGETAVGIRLNLSQSFGYSVAGGEAFYGPSRLGFVPLATAAVPEPGALALSGLALGILGFSRRRRSAER